MSKGLFDLIFDSIFDENWVGRHGEKLTEKELKWVNRFGRKGRILRNVYIPKGNGQTSEIDVLYITQKGIFVMESKNYSGWIFGDEVSQYWTAMLPNREKNRFYNPIKQNRAHIKWLGNYIGADVPLFSIIVFSERCTLKKVTVESPDIKVVSRDRLYATVRDIWDSREDALSEEAAETLHGKLKALTNVDSAVKAAHVRSIEARYKSGQGKTSMNNAAIAAAAKKTVDPKPEAKETGRRVCPRCGRELVLRTARKGSNAGEQFYGCSGFPHCRYTEKA